MSKPAIEKVLIKPSRADLRVRKPNGQLLDPAGELVTWSAYWRRREIEKDIERVSAEVEPKVEHAAEQVNAKVKTKPAATAPTNAE